MIDILSVLCGVFAAICLVYEYMYTVQKKELSIISFVRVTYAFVYGVLPCLYYNRYLIDVSAKSLYKLNEGSAWLMFVFSLCGYFLLNFGYRLRISSLRKDVETRNDFAELPSVSTNKNANRKILLFSIACVCIGWFSLYVWTRSYGSFSMFIENAARIRSGYGVKNSYAFFKHFAKLTNITTPMLFGYIFIQYYETKKLNLVVLASLVASVSGSVMFMLCSDSRTDFALVLISMIFPVVEYFSVRKKYSTKRMVISLAVLFVAVILLSTIISDIMDSYRFESEYEADSDGVISTIIAEFNHLIRSQQKSIEILFSNEYKSWLKEDALNALFAWLPSRFSPSDMPVTLWTHNTILVTGSTNEATLPTDFITTSIYWLGVLGPYIVPVVMGAFVHIIEKIIKQMKNRVYALILKYVFAIKLVWLVAYCQLYSIFYENLYLFIFIIGVPVMMKISITNNKSTTRSIVHEN